MDFIDSADLQIIDQISESSIEFKEKVEEYTNKKYKGWKQKEEAEKWILNKTEEVKYLSKHFWITHTEATIILFGIDNIPSEQVA